MLPISADSFPLYIPIDLDEIERRPLTLDLHQDRYLLLFNDFERAEAVIVADGIQEGFGVGVIQDAEQLLLWLKAAQNRGTTRVFWNSNLVPQEPCAPGTRDAGRSDWLDERNFGRIDEKRMSRSFPASMARWNA